MPLLHLLLQNSQDVIFHNVVFRSFSNLQPRQVEDLIEKRAEQMLKRLVEQRPATMREAIRMIGTFPLEECTGDRDVGGEAILATSLLGRAAV